MAGKSIFADLMTPGFTTGDPFSRKPRVDTSTNVKKQKDIFIFDELKSIEGEMNDLIMAELSSQFFEKASIKLKSSDIPDTQIDPW